MRGEETAVKIYINNIQRDVDKGFVIDFVSSYGEGVATYIGEKPAPNKECFVEVDIEGVLKWGEDIEKCSAKLYKIEKLGNLIWIYGTLESLDEDGYAILRIGESMVSLETSGENFPIGSNIKVKSSNVKFYDVGY